MKHILQISVALLAASFTPQSYCQQETFWYKGVTIALIQGDITTQQVDAIVNAANIRLQHDGGVARAISIAAGPELQKASDALIQKSGIFKPGTAIETDSFNLSKQGVKFIIHAFGPDLSDPQQKKYKESLLQSAYTQSLEVANDLGLTSIAFPAISTKIFGYNIQEATPVAIKAVRDYLDISNSSITEIYFIVFDSADYAIYKSVLDTIFTQQSIPRPMSPAAKPYLAPAKKDTGSSKTTSKTPLPKKAVAKPLVKKTPTKPVLKPIKQPIKRAKTPVRKIAIAPAKTVTPRVAKKAPITLKKAVVKKPVGSRVVPGKALQKPKNQPKMQKIAIQKTKPSVQLKKPTVITIPKPPKIKHVTFNKEPEIIVFEKEDAPEEIIQYKTKKYVLPTEYIKTHSTTHKPIKITPALLPVAEPTTYTLYDVLKNRIPTNTKVRAGDDLTSAFVGSILGGALGDAFGRVTEFDKPIANIFTKRAKGIVSFADFTPSDWVSIPQQYQTASPQIAPWTDDTAMTKVVLEQLIAMKQNKWDFDTTIGNIATATVEDEKKELGWAAGFRAPGIACLTGTQILQQKIPTKTQPKGWWDIQATQAGGCGSVMRAHPFGLAFWYNPNRAANFAMAGSKITHGAPIAVAGSACMAVAVALAVQQESVEDIISALIETAKKYAPHAAPNDKGYNPSLMTLAQKIERAQKDAEAAKLAYESNNRSEFNKIHEQFFTQFEGSSADDAVAGMVFAFCLFPDDLLRAIAVGVHTPGDSDSIASMAGALVGAFVGEGQIPTDTQLGAQLEQRKELIQLAKALADLCKPAKPIETPVVKGEKTESLPDYLLAKIATPEAITNLIAELKKPPYAKITPYPQPTPNWAQAAVKPYVWFYNSYDPYYEFANFWKSPVMINGSLWPTTEHYFQAGKFIHHPALQEQIRQIPNSSDVFKLANSDVNKTKKRADWDTETTFIPLMYKALVAKFTQHPSLQKVLLNTNNACIIEDTAQAKRDDMRWGAGKNYQGENYLGRLLMYIRDEIKKYNSGT